jgi:SpoVK/Ycf46/Vps4 family AAA+-type ATPase
LSLQNRPEISLYRRTAAHITTRKVLHPLEKEAAISAVPFFRRKRVKAQLEAEWHREESAAAREATRLIEVLREAVDALSASLEELGGLKLPELLGKVEGEQIRVKNAHTQISSALGALQQRDFGAAGAAVDGATRELWLAGGTLVVALNQSLAQAAIGREHRGRLEANVAERRSAQANLEKTRREQGTIAALEVAARVYKIEAEGLSLATEILSSQVRQTTAPKAKVGREGSLRVIPPQELEMFAEVGGLEEVKEQLKSTIGAILERPDEAVRYRVVHNGILFHGPPGTGKTLLSRALAGEYGMRYIRFSPAQIASSYIHEAAVNLQRLFELAQDQVPCVLFLDEIDVIASPRDDQPSAEHREVVTQLMNCLEEYRAIPGLVIIAATNNIDRLDPGLREGRFDAKIFIPLPDPEARREIFRVHLERRGEAVDWDALDFDELVRLTASRTGAALEGFVTLAAQTALKKGHPIKQEDLIEAIHQREGKDRLPLEERVTWQDVVLLDDTREQLMEIVNAFSRPDLARSLGIRPPAGVLLYGPPGTGKTTFAKALATEVEASFYEQSAADLLSKWVGESEERIAKLFSKARANRPSIVFVDEIDALLRQRSADSAAPWEQRVVSQFLKELDGLVAGEGVLLVGATNRIDIIDPAIVGRRLVPIEVGLPDAIRRIKILEVLCKHVALERDVNLKAIAAESEGLSGADLKRIRDIAGMKALNRAASEGGGSKPVTVTMADFATALDSLRNRSSLVEV